MLIISLILIVGVSSTAGKITGETTPNDPFDIRIIPDIQWSGGQFQWPCDTTKSMYKSAGRYIAKNVIATRGQIWREELFVAMPRYKAGIPVTLAKIRLPPPGKRDHSPVFVPFPCWSMQEEGNCKALQSVVDIFLDRHDVLWVLDIGIVQTFETPIRKCQPKVIGFNVKTGRVMTIISLEGLYTDISRLQYLVVDYDEDDNGYLYISDGASRSIIVYDVRASRGYRVILPKQLLETGSKRDVLYLSLLKKSCGTTYVYLTYLSGRRMFSIKSEYLRKGYAQGKIIDCGMKPDRMVVIGTDNGSAMIFRKEGHPEVFRWDSNTDFKRDNFKVVFRCEPCQLATHAIADYRRQRIRLLESNFPDYIENRCGCGAEQQLSIMQAFNFQMTGDFKYLNFEMNGFIKFPIKCLRIMALILLKDLQFDPYSFCYTFPHKFLRYLIRKLVEEGGNLHEDFNTDNYHN